MNAPRPSSAVEVPGACPTLSPRVLSEAKPPWPTPRTQRPLLGNPLVIGCLPEFTFWIKSTRLRVWRTQVQVWSVAVHSAPQCKRGVHWKLLWRLQEHTERPARARESSGTGDFGGRERVAWGCPDHVPFDQSLSWTGPICPRAMLRPPDGGQQEDLPHLDIQSRGWAKASSEMTHHSGIELPSRKEQGWDAGSTLSPRKSSLQPCPASSTGAPVCSKKDTAAGNVEQ